jgi:hypothetical protein
VDARDKAGHDALKDDRLNQHSTATWFNVFAATGAFFYYSIFKSPPWLNI